MAEIILSKMESPRPKNEICPTCKVNPKEPRRSYCNPCATARENKKRKEREEENRLYGIV